MFKKKASPSFLQGVQGLLQHLLVGPLFRFWLRRYAQHGTSCWSLRTWSCLVKPASSETTLPSSSLKSTIKIQWWDFIPANISVGLLKFTLWQMHFFTANVKYWPLPPTIYCPLHEMLSCFCWTILICVMLIYIYFLGKKLFCWLSISVPGDYTLDFGWPIWISRVWFEIMCKNCNRVGRLENAKRHARGISLHTKKHIAYTCCIPLKWKILCVL